MGEEASNARDIRSLERDIATLQERSLAQGKAIENLSASKVDRSEFDFFRRFLYGVVFTGTGGLIVAFYKLLGISK